MVGGQLHPMVQNNIQKNYHIHISAKHRLLDLKLKDVWQYRDLIRMFAKRNFTIYYKQTILGPAWLFLSPLITGLMYAFVFGGIAKIDTDGVPGILFYLSGTAIWTFFSSSLTKNASAFTANAGLFGKVYFPRLTIPIANVISSAIDLGFHFLPVLLFMIYYIMIGEVMPNWSALALLPICLIHLGIMGLGFGIIISSLTTKYRDLSILVGFGVTLWMYATPIVYPVSMLNDGWMKTLLLLNPATMPIEFYRYALLGKGTVDLFYLAISWMTTIMVALLGTVIFNKVERSFMDTV